MSVNGYTYNRLIERAEDYLPNIFKDRSGKTADRVYTHFSCNKSASYNSFKIARFYNYNKCPMCSSFATKIVSNEDLSRCISNFLQNFNLRNNKDAKSSYKLAKCLFQEEQFTYVAKICRRAFCFLAEPKVNKKIQTLSEQAERMISQQNRTLEVQKERELESLLGINKNLQKIQSLENDLKICLERLESSDNDIERSYLKAFIEMYYKNIAYETKIAAGIYVDNKMHQKAINRFEEASLLYMEAINQDVTDFSEKKSIFKDLASNLENLGDVFVSLNRFAKAIENYEEAINYLNSAIDLCENESDFKNELVSELDKFFFKLSNAYLFLADEYSIQERELVEAKKYLEKAQKTLENIKEKNEEIKRFSDLIIGKIEIIELKLEMADLIKLYNEDKSNNK